MENNENKEGTKDIDRYEKIVELAREEIAGVRTVYIWLAATLGIIIATGLTIGTILIGHSVSDMKKSMNDEFQSMKSGVYADVNIFQRQVNSRIDEEFKKEKIQSLIEDKAREYTERSAQQYIAMEVNGVIAPFKKEFENTTNDANAQIQKLNNLYYIFYLASHAKSGSKSAYLDLKKYVASVRTEEAIVASDNLMEIQRGLLQYRFVYHQSPDFRTDVYNYPKYPNDLNRVYVGDYSADALADMLVLNNCADSDRRVIMEYISKKPKEDIFKTAIKVFESDSLPACAIFGGVLYEISEKKADFLDFDAWTEICKKQINKQ
jgi:hypothetical protein